MKVTICNDEKTAVSTKELRLGNIVNDDEKVISISFDGTVEVSYDSAEKGNATQYKDISKIKPIPLTEEWLLRFGFKDVSGNIEKRFVKGRFNWYSSTRYITVEFDNGLSNFDLDTDCRYVHQLQNLYHTINGEELKYDL